MITPELPSAAVALRPNATILNDETKEALASYFAGQLLYPYIYPFSRLENQEKLGWRRFQTIKHYRNYPAEIASQYVEGVFRSRQVERLFNDTTFDSYLHTDYNNWFVKQFASFSLLLPETWIIISKPDSCAEVVTKQDERELGILPYASIVYPHYVQNFALGRDGKVDWVSFRNPGKDYFTIYTRSSILQIAENGTVLNEVLHGWQETPVVRIAWQENTAYEGTAPIGHSFLKTVVDLSLANLQYTSMLVEMGYFHLAYKVIMGPETAKKAIEEGVGNQTPIIEFEEEKGTTRYLELPPMEIEALKDIIYDRNQSAIYKAARLVDRGGQVQQSGVAKTIDMMPEIAALSSVAEFWRKADREIVRLMAQGYFGDALFAKKMQQARIQYPSTFDRYTAQDSITDLTKLTSAISSSNLPFSQTFMKEMMKRVQRSLLPDATPEQLKKMDEEMEDSSTNSDTAAN